jgi:hypothetical protein
MTPCTAWLSSSTSMASSEDGCHDPFTSIAASAENETAAPGEITVASRRMASPPVVNLTFGCARGGNGFRTPRERRTGIATAQRQPDEVNVRARGSAVCMIETASWPATRVGRPNQAPRGGGSGAFEKHWAWLPRRSAVGRPDPQLTDIGGAVAPALLISARIKPCSKTATKAAIHAIGSR